MTKLSSADIAKYFELREKLVADTLATPHEIVCAASERCRAAYGAGAGDMHFYHADKWLDAFHQTYAMSGQPWQPMLIALEVMIRNELESRTKTKRRGEWKKNGMARTKMSPESPPPKRRPHRRPGAQARATA